MSWTVQKLINHLTEIRDKHGAGDLPVTMLTEILEPIKIQIEDPITDVGYSKYGVILIGVERFYEDG